MPMTLYPGGLGRTYGHQLIAGNYLQTSAKKPLWVDSNYGGAGGSGRSEHNPFLTLVAAYAAAEEGDLIVLMDGHEETLSADLVLGTPGVKICGAGATNGVPNCVINVGDDYEVRIDNDDQLINNIRFETTATRANHPCVEVTGGSDGVELSDCYFNLVGAGVGLQVGDGVTANLRLLLERNQFISNGTAIGVRPLFAMVFLGDLGNMRWVGNTIDSGEWGWGNTYAVWFDYFVVINQFSALDTTLLRGADILLPNTEPTDIYFAGVVRTGGAMISVYEI